MKKIFVFIISSLLIFGVVGCNAQSQTNTTPQSSIPTSIISSTASSEEGTVFSSSEAESSSETPTKPVITPVTPVEPASLPDYISNPYSVVNRNQPIFPELTTQSYEYYSDLDNLGRCGFAIACIGKDLMPTESRGSISMVMPTGWQSVTYDSVDGKYLYNRCHLIGYQLTAENANEKNLITGTRYLNIEGMLPFENMVADYIKETNNHVMYRVTPVFEGSNLVASGVQMEGYSIEDYGAGICFNVYCYNLQPGITINYADGSSNENKTVEITPKQESIEKSESSVVSEVSRISDDTTARQSTTYILNTNTKKFHRTGCSAVKQMKESNKQTFTGSREEVINKGYSPCKKCNP